MSTLRFALAQFDFPVGAVAKNGEHVRELMCRARAARAELIAFPELTLAGYPPEDLLLRPSFLAACEKELAAVAASSSGIAAYLGHPHTIGEVYNAASLVADGEIVFTTHKQALPNYTVFDEKRYFQSGSDSAVSDFANVRVGWLICEDIWEQEPASRAVAKGAELLMVINASPFDDGKSAQREELLARRARENNVAIAYLNVVGGQDDLIFDGGSLLVEPDGRIAARAPPFSDVLLIAEYDNVARRFVAENWPSEKDESKEARVYAALVRGVRDYVEKNHFPGVLLGLSGGIDSSLVLAIAVDALGPDKVTAVRLPSRYTSDMSNHLADVQARKLGVQLLTIPIEAPFNAFIEELAPAFKHVKATLNDVTEENMQSRCRGITLMALSNKTGRMVLSTGNKSEYAVGYATIYGDMCGGFAPIKDCYKQLVYALSRWRNEQGDGEIIPIKVIDRPPSAELRANQTDQDSLPPYEELDAILDRFIEREQSQAEIVAEGFNEETVRRVARLVLASEYKRRQSAPGPKISTRAFGRDRRYPITSGWR